MKDNVIKQKTKIFLKNHWLAILIALIVGIVIIFPQFLFIYQAGDSYQGFNIFETDAEYYYIARINEVYDGHYKIGNPFLSEGKNLPYAQPPLPEIIMGGSGKILHLGIGPTLILFRFVGPFLLFLLLYFLVLSITGNDKKSALLAPVIIILAPNLIFHLQELWGMIIGTFSPTQFLNYARPINPQISSLFLFAFLYLFWKLFNSPRQRYLYYCLLLFGLSFYVYPYTWSFLLVFMFVYMAILFWRRKRESIKKIIKILIGGLIIAIPYFINTYQLISHSSYKFLKDAYGTYTSHEFIFSKVLFLGLIILLILYFLINKKNKQFFWYFFALVLSGFIAINQQVITGHVLYYGHYHWYINKPLVIIVMIIFMMALFRKLRLRKTIYLLISIIIFISFFSAYYVQSYSYQHYFEKYLDAQKYGTIIKWLNKHAQKDEVVYVPGCFSYPSGPSQTLTKFIFSYTSLNVYYYKWVPYYLSPYHDYSFHNLFITLKLLDINPKDVHEYLSNNSDIFRDIYMNYFKVRGLDFKDISSEEIYQIAERYREFYQMLWEEIFAKYPIDYIVWDKGESPDLPFDTIAKNENIYYEVYNNQDIIVYKFSY